MAVFRVPATITWTGSSGGPGVNVWSVRTFEGSAIVDELDAALDALQTFYTSLGGVYRGGTTITLGPDIVNRETLDDESRPARSIPLGDTTTGTANALAMVASWRTPLRMRRGMGRTFIGPLNSGSVEGDGTLHGVRTQNLLDAANALLAQSTTDNAWAIGVWGLAGTEPAAYDANKNLVPGQPHVHRDITQVKVRDSIALLRSRRD